MFIRNKKMLVYFVLLFSMICWAADDLRIADFKCIDELTPMLSFPPEMLDIPMLNLDEAERVLKSGPVVFGDMQDENYLANLLYVLKISDRFNFLAEKKSYSVFARSAITIEFPTLNNMFKIKKCLMTEDAEQRINKLSSAQLIIKKLLALDIEFEDIYKQIDNLFDFVSKTQCFNQKNKKKESVNKNNKEKAYRFIDFLIVDHYAPIVSIMNLINTFNKQSSVDNYYIQGTASQCLLVKFLYNDFNIAFFKMLKAFEYIQNEEKIFLLAPERIKAIHALCEKEYEYQVVYMKNDLLSEMDRPCIDSFLIPVKNFYVHHVNQFSLLFNKGKMVDAPGILINEVRNINDMENPLNEYQVCALSKDVGTLLFEKSLIAEYKKVKSVQHVFSSLDFYGKDSFGQEFGYIKTSFSVDTLLEEILYLEQLMDTTQSMHKALEDKSSKISEEEIKEIIVFTEMVNPQVHHALEYRLGGIFAIDFIPEKVEERSGSSSSESIDDVAQKAFEKLVESEKMIEQAKKHYEKVAREYYEKQIIDEQVKIRESVASGKIYDAKKKTVKSSGRGKQKQPKKAEKKSEKISLKKEKEALSRKAEEFLKENKIKVSVKKRELDLIAKQLIKILDPHNIVTVSSNIDGSHEIFHVEGAESVTRAGHGNNPEFQSSAANSFLMNRARQIETSLRAKKLQEKLEEK